MKVGSTAYSYRKYLSSGEMTLEGFLDKAVEIGLDCVDLTSYYFPATDDEYLNHIKKYAYLNGLDITGTAVGNRFTQVDPGKRAEAVQMLRNGWTSRLHWARRVSEYLPVACRKVILLRNRSSGLLNVWRNVWNMRSPEA